MARPGKQTHLPLKKASVDSRSLTGLHFCGPETGLEEMSNDLPEADLGTATCEACSRESDKSLRRQTASERGPESRECRRRILAPTVFDKTLGLAEAPSDSALRFGFRLWRYGFLCVHRDRSVRVRNEKRQRR